MNLDITHHKELEEELERSEKKYRDIFNNIRNPIFVLDADTLEFTLRKNLERMAENFRLHPEQAGLLQELLSGIELVYALPFDVNLRKIQDLHYGLARSTYPEYNQKAEQGNDGAALWVKNFETLSKKLMIRLE